ncbi:MAG: stage 0 sporulation family protein [Lachnospiraceae bacterium]|nr:stage 0 sporulation family protein [Lachnospiraceae bacterium]
MIEIIGVRFRENGKIYYFAPEHNNVEVGDHVIVETIRGVEYGSVVLGRRTIEEGDKPAIKPIKRIANEEDAKQYEENIRQAKEAFKLCEKKIAKHELDMKLIDSEYTFDKNKLIFYFASPNRVDFRELVRDLANEFHTRIELRQIGVRDETRLLGGMGICGRPLCCATFLSEFGGVSIKMAKEQNLAMTPSKISGVCGRLMCCLKNEQAAYEYLNSKMPAVGDKVITPDGAEAEVKNVNVLRETVRAVIRTEDDDIDIVEYKVDDLKFTPRKKKPYVKKNNNQNNMNEADDAELKDLEKEDRKYGIED